jgi:hypothetical protein
MNNAPYSSSAAEERTVGIIVLGASNPHAVFAFSISGRCGTHRIEFVRTNKTRISFWISLFARSQMAFCRGLCDRILRRCWKGCDGVGHRHAPWLDCLKDSRRRFGSQRLQETAPEESIDRIGYTRPMSVLRTFVSERSIKSMHNNVFG